MNSKVVFCMVMTIMVIGAAAQDYDKATNGDTSCTKGRMWISEANTGAIRVFNLDNGFTQVGSFAASVAANTNMYQTETGKVVAAVTKGTAATNFTDGITRFFSTGLDGTVADTPMQHSYSVPCTSPVHFTTVHGWIALHCDGYYTTNTDYYRNATAVYLNEAHLYNTESTVDNFNWVQPSAHHGLAWAFDEDHFLYSVATDARTAKQSTDSLPAGFVLAFRNGTEVHDLSDVEDTHKSCHGFHGEVHVNNRFAFGCDSSIDDTHDGILVVTKNEATETYTSRKLSYPDNVGTARTSTLQSNHHTGYFIGNFGSHLLAFTGTEATADVSESLVVNITGSCAWHVDRSYDGYIYWLSNQGYLRAYKIQNNQFALQQTIQVFSSSITCSNVALVPGFGVVAILRRDTNSVAYVNIPLGTVTSYSLSFTPQAATIVAQEELFCRACDTCLDGAGEGKANSASSSASISAMMMVVIMSVSSMMAKFF